MVLCDDEWGCRRIVGVGCCVMVGSDVHNGK